MEVKAIKVQAAVGENGELVPGIGIHLRTAAAAQDATGVPLSDLVERAFKKYTNTTKNYLVGPRHDLWLFRRTA